MKLSTKVGDIAGIGPSYSKRLEKLGIKTIKDLIYHFPFRYSDMQEVKKISQVRPNEVASVQGQITSFTNIYTKTGKRMQEAIVSDGDRDIYAVWFNQTYLSKTLPVGTNVSLAGKVSFWKKRLALFAPAFEKLTQGVSAIHTQGLVPVYPETQGLSSKWLRNKLAILLPSILDQIKDPLPRQIRGKYNLAPLLVSIKNIHFPAGLADDATARKRLAFDELLALQLISAKRRKYWQNTLSAISLKISPKSKQDFLSLLPFELTGSQKLVMQELENDFDSNTPMNRLLEGDVGSGKTVVAAYGAYLAFQSGYQTILMAPTQILASQHYATLSSLFSKTNIKISLITSQTAKTNLNAANILVGTHALIHKKTNFNTVAFIVIDEQHRFGVEQRKHLITNTSKGGKFPHVLTMTATPIPRTIALTVYGDLTLSTITEMPKGRQAIKTMVVTEKKRKDAYTWIAKQIKETGAQVYVVCPLIEESEAETLKNVKSAKAEYERLVKIFKQFRVELLHGKIKPKDREVIIANFRNQTTQILVSTPVIEVGIDIPNATIMVIEAAERFGLASLHQLRGRVGRGLKKSYCLLFTQSMGGNTQKRLSALSSNKTGFELAEIDLAMRGPGEVMGTRQHGLSELKIASWQDTELIIKTREAADYLVANEIRFMNTITKIVPKQAN